MEILFPDNVEARVPLTDRSDDTELVCWAYQIIRATDPAVTKAVAQQYARKVEGPTESLFCSIWRRGELFAKIDNRVSAEALYKAAHNALWED